MDSHRATGSPDVRIQRGYTQPHSPRGSQDNMFGVRVRVQGIKGQPYVVLNSSGQENHRDISVITHQAGYNPGVVRRSEDEGRPLSETPRTPNSSMFHYQKHPELLRPYDPESNNLNQVLPSQTASASRPAQLHAGLAPVTKPRIPLPAEGPGLDPAEETKSKTPFSGRHIPARSPNAVETHSIMSVGKLISQFNSSQRRGRGPRNKLDPEECRRSRSADSGRISDSSSSSSSSSRTSSLKGIRGESPGVIYPPGSARARLLSREATLTSKKGESKPSKQFVGHNGKETLLHRAETLSVSRSCDGQASECDERDAQVRSFSSEQSFH